mgnify:FL=1
MLQGIIIYELFSLLMMTAWLQHEGESFFDATKKHIADHNRKLKERLELRQISPMVYKNGLHFFEREKSFCIVVNYIVAPILAPFILITITVSAINDIM